MGHHRFLLDIMTLEEIDTKITESNTCRWVRVCGPPKPRLVGLPMGIPEAGALGAAHSESGVEGRGTSNSYETHFYQLALPPDVSAKLCCINGFGFSDRAWR